LKADISQLTLPHGTKNQKRGKEKKAKNENSYAQKYRQTVRRIHGVSPKKKKKKKATEGSICGKGRKPGVKRVRE